MRRKMIELIVLSFFLMIILQKTSASSGIPVYVGLNEDLPAYFELPINAEKFVKNQGSLNCCASHAICTGVEIMHAIKGTNLEVPLSERHHYYIARQKEINGEKYMGNFPQNEGMYSRTMLHVAQSIALTPEKLCPYISNDMNINRFKFTFSN